jgi:RNA recognition motif-containing protein
MMVKLFVGGIPLDTTEMDLAQLISPHATVCTIQIIRDKMTKKLKGYAFVEVASREDADQAMDALNGTPMGDRELTLNIAPDKPKPAPQAPRKYVKMDRPQPGEFVKKKRPRKEL